MPSTDALELSTLLPVPPERVYAAWLDGDEHAEMTGASATSDPRVGGRFTAWDGYIEGTYLELHAPYRIVQAWRTSEFPDGAPDSRLEIELQAEGRGTRLTLRHSQLPDGDGGRYAEGWKDFYFEPMVDFLVD